MILAYYSYFLILSTELAIEVTIIAFLVRIFESFNEYLLFKEKAKVSKGLFKLGFTIASKPDERFRATNCR